MTEEKKPCGVAAPFWWRICKKCPQYLKCEVPVTDTKLCKIFIAEGGIDPLEVLQAWREHYGNQEWCRGCFEFISKETEVIKELHTNLEEVIERGYKEGWWK